ncbi:MAG: hypothetical protein JSS40_18225 [Proteobacteria bacterium]|nr:hypothetical protein [Pseudomonadota bacterium]
MKMTELSRVLGLSKAQVSKPAQRGMPLDDVAAADAWRAEHLEPAWMKRKAPAPAGLPLFDPMEVAHNVLRGFLSRSAAWPIFHPLAVSSVLHEAGIQASDDQARRFAALLLVTWASYADEIVDGDELLFELPAWANDDAPLDDRRPSRYRMQTFELPMMLGFEGSNSFALALAPSMHRKAGVTAKRGNWSKRSVLPHRGRCIYVAGPALFLCAAGMTE